MKKFFMRLIIILFFTAGCVGGCTLLNKKLGLKDDNPIEELTEEVIRARTGMDIDLTPESEEI